MTRRGPGRPPHPDVLTPGEWTVLDMWRHGLRRSDISRRRGVSPYAVRYHLRNIVDKLGVASMSELRHWPGIPHTSQLARLRAATDRLETTERRTAMSTRGAAHPSSGLALGPIGQVSLYARDAARTESWYRDVLGLPHVFTFGDLVFFDCDGVRLYIHAVGDEKWRPGSVLYFRVDDVHVAHDELVRRGVKVTAAPHMIYKDDPTGDEEWMAFFEDPDTNLLALMARVPASA